MNKKLFNNKMLDYFEIDLEVQDISKNTITFKTYGIKDKPFLMEENVELKIEPTKISVGIGDGKYEEPIVKRGMKFKLILKKIN
jgi:hypothetical protein